MQVLNAVFLVLLCLSWSSVNCYIQEEDSFDFYYFVRLWLGGECQNDKCVFVRVNDFTIHGLWPNYSNGKWPQWCNVRTNQFQEDKITDILGELETWWPSSQNKANADEEFWAHEWNKHGTCALPEFDYSEYNFFQTILNMHHQYNITDALDYNNIMPNEYVKYSIFDLEESVSSYFGARARVSCWGDGLSEVWMCYDLDLNLIDCPVQQSNCGDVYYKPFTTIQVSQK
eukprot:TRINITY_DN4823_c0_g1_i4.p4 TRINITY_DN4823_c0_g1~~TRINITY_DN4823_c0_g1_i4.p4  ORF type:complete len:229 (-),score=16.60 TRINITY_DN4823_c0_g1_i4:1505-2191(-)